MLLGEKPCLACVNIWLWSQPYQIHKQFTNKQARQEICCAIEGPCMGEFPAVFRNRSAAKHLFNCAVYMKDPT